jgi:antitoxin (DNA-binding transcriptional repressor) of toxin-antitoxin stability system
MKKIELNTPAASEQAIRDGQAEEVVVLQDGHPVALVVPFDGDDLEWYARERDPAFIESIARAREQAEAGQTLSQDDLKRQLGLE